MFYLYPFRRNSVAAKQDIKTRFKFQKVYMKNLQEV